METKLDFPNFAIDQMHGFQLHEFLTFLNGEFGELKFPYLWDMQIMEGLDKQIIKSSFSTAMYIWMMDAR